jgi:PEGA domain
MLRRALQRRCLFILVGMIAFAGAACAAEPADLAFVFVGEADPSGADEAFLRLGRKRDLPTVREQPGRLQEPPRARLAKAVEAYARLQLDDARARLDALETEVAAAGGAGLDRGELIELFATRAAVRFATGNEAQAWDDLLQVAAFAPARPLDPARFPPRVIETEKRAAEALAAGGKLSASATPADADLSVDGLPVGRGTVEVVLPAGRHFVRAERGGFLSAGKTIEIARGGDATLTLPLSSRSAPAVGEFTRAAAVLGARRVVGAFIGARGDAPTLELLAVVTAGGDVRARAQLEVGRLTTAELEAAVDRLAPPPRDKRPWFKRPLVWGLVGGGLAAAALAVGLGVGLSGGHVAGWSAHVDLTGAR